ncbi:hypothetical protein FDK12_11290 [Arthrobacter sp. NamB2]|uniref:hypothetical protein n=1 Tax=Arthrobacter sp. NamB2 TaxID=2576035 RepID=UPI0010C96FED|nr:hypothetical protein [Arthrobacter sp. NamB2]TKV27292.1 hypothetical protein FDK12_11290 [Arthrobacter sp. NamB2]
MRLLRSAVGPGVLTVVLGVALTGCSQGSASPADTMLTMPASPSPQPSALPTPSLEPAPLQSEGPPADAATQGRVSGASDHCVVVAGGVTTAMLAPLGLRSHPDASELVTLRQQILDFRDKVPVDLQDEFETLAHSVEVPPEGSGIFDEKAFRHAIVPVQDWLGQHCAGS